MSRSDWHDPDYRAAWREVTRLTPVLDQPEPRARPTVPEWVLGWLVFVALILLPFLPLVLLGCTGEPLAPAGTVQIDPPPEYRVWWEASRACVHKVEWRRFEAVDWYVSPDLLPATDGERHVALTRGGAIYLWAPYAESPWVIQHELVHAVNGIDGHPTDPFVTCALMPFQHHGPL